jgi:phosphohistidine swiveling domain-containing protein
MSYQNYEWEVIGVEYDSPYLRNRLWTQSFFRIPRLLGVPRVVAAITSRNNKIEYVADLSTLGRAHDELKSRILRDYAYLERAIDMSLDFGEQLNAWTQKHIFDVDLTKLSNQELNALFNDFVDKQEDENVYGQVLSFLDYHFSFMDTHLSNYLRSQVGTREFEEYYSLFTEPPYTSFAQDQEESLLQILARFWPSGPPVELAQMSLDRNKAAYPDFFAALARHAKENAWIYFVHMGPAFGEKEFYDFVVDYARRGIDPRVKFAELQEKRELIASRKKEVWEILQPAGLDAFLLQIGGKIVWAKARRKDHQSRAYYHGEKLLREMARRLVVPLEDVRSAPFEWLCDALSGGEPDFDGAEEIRRFHICLPNDDGVVTTLTGQQAEDFSRDRIRRSGEAAEPAAGVWELQGTIACRGKAVGRAKIINVPQEMGKMEYGDILVSSTTTPSIVPALRKAAAIVTDGGGLTCHAAIVSREFNIPCIVGVKIATSVIKDGDLLEVDAGAARVRRLVE